jgi:hypothetical protein
LIIVKSGCFMSSRPKEIHREEMNSYPYESIYA